LPRKAPTKNVCRRGVQRTCSMIGAVAFDQTRKREDV
jgi:hypothetical protein